jgi:peptidoglycan L-alanyl-D-glutamate endopeptidase CwlK
MFELSGKSLCKLNSVHPDLIRVTKRAIKISKIDFGVLDGARSYQKQCELVKSGDSHTLHSLHLLQDDGYAHAIDVFAWVNGNVSWKNLHYGPIVQAFITAATALEIQLEFGHLWHRFGGSGQDSVHIQLNPKYQAGKEVAI